VTLVQNKVGDIGRWRRWPCRSFVTLDGQKVAALCSREYGKGERGWRGDYHQFLKISSKQKPRPERAGRGSQRVASEGYAILDAALARYT
jgi:hypothetical protein